MTKIYLARHAQDQDNAEGVLNGHRDMPLTEIGLNQADQLSQKIKESGIIFDKIFSSPLQRAYQTAEKIAKKLKMIKPDKLDLLIERDFGVMTGKLTKNIESLCSPDIIKTKTITYFLSPAGAETFPQLVVRAKKVLNFIKNKYKDQSILLVTHGDLGKMLYAVFYDLDWENVLTLFHFGNSDLLLLAKDSATEDIHVFNTKRCNH